MIPYTLQTRTTDNWQMQMFIDAFEQYDNFFDWMSLFQMLDTYANLEREANACHVAVVICNVVAFQIKNWNSQGKRNSTENNSII